MIRSLSFPGCGAGRRGSPGGRSPQCVGPWEDSSFSPRTRGPFPLRVASAAAAMTGFAERDVRDARADDDSGRGEVRRERETSTIRSREGEAHAYEETLTGRCVYHGALGWADAARPRGGLLHKLGLTQPGG